MISTSIQKENKIMIWTATLHLSYGRARFAAPEAQQNYSSASLPPHQTTGGEEN
jgi:hypothetical protein